jgi:hypothetical protein
VFKIVTVKVIIVDDKSQRLTHIFLFDFFFFRIKLTNKNKEKGLNKVISRQRKFPLAQWHDVRFSADAKLGSASARTA